MKKLTCKDLGGACDAVITGASFAEMGKNARAHVMANMDDAHRAMMGKMQNATDEQRAAWMAEFEKKFHEAPDA